MQHLTKTNIIFCMVIVILLGTMPLNAHALDDAIIAVVNNEPITFGEFNDYLHAIYVNLVSSGKSKEEIQTIMSQMKSEGLNRLIDDTLIVSEAKRRGVQVRSKAIDEKMEEVRKKYPSEEAFLDALVSNGSTLSDLRNKIEQQLQLSFIIDKEIRSKIVVTPSEITKYYTDHPEEFLKPERLKLDSITIPYGDNRRDAQKKARTALALIRRGKDFKKVMQDFSGAPSIGSINKGQMKKDIEAILFRLKPGEVSSLVNTDTGIYIFKVNQKLPRETAPLEETRDFIYNKLFQKKFEERYNEWIEQLREDAYIEIKQ